MNNTYGWAIDLSITEVGAKHLIAINLSLPGGNAKADWLAESNLLECYGKFKNWDDAVKDLMKPWTWKNLKWYLFKFENSEWNKINKYSKTEGGQNNYLSIIESINFTLDDIGVESSMDIIGRTEKWKPFDVENTRSGQTLVHALAPLAYLPSDISSSLNLSFTTLIDDGFNPQEGDQYVIFPKFELGSIDIMLESPKSICDDYAMCDYSGEELGFNIRFYCSVEKEIKSVPPTVALSLPDTNPVVLKSNILTFISPASLFVKSILSNKANIFPAEFYQKESNEKEGNKKTLIESLILCLFRSIGAGWGLSRLEDRLGSELKNSYCYENLLNAFVDEKNIKFVNINKEHKSINQRPEFLSDTDALINLLKTLSQLTFSDATLSKFIECCKKLHVQLNQQSTSKTEVSSLWVPDSLLPILGLMQNQETLKKISILCWGALYQARSEDLQKILLKGIGQSLLDEAQFSLLVESPYVEDLNISQDIKKLKLLDGIALGNALFGLLFGKNDELRNQIIHTIFQEASQLIEANNKASEYHTKPKDDGIKFGFNDNNELTDQEYRGYAIALEVSKDKNNCESGAWITDVQIGLTQNKKIISEFLHETIGASKVNGGTVGSFEYTGNPLNSSKVKINSDNTYEYINKYEYKEDHDGTDYIDYVWPYKRNGYDDQELPPKLGYGLWYRGIATPLGNAGEIFDYSLRSKSKSTKLIKASEAIKKITTNFQQYLSCVPPGSPTVLFDAESLTKLQELSEETKAYVYQSSVAKLNKPLPVALLCNEEESFVRENCSPSFILRFHKPIPNIDFLEKWKNGEDHSSIKLEDFSTELEEFTKLKNKDYLHFNNNDEDAIRKKVQQTLNAVCIHPAVEKVLVSVQINGSKNFFKALVVEDLRMLTIERSTKDYFDEGSLKIELNDSSFCKVEFYSLIKEELFSGDNKKFNSDAFDNGFKNDRGEVTNKIQIEQEEYRQFGPAEYWFEAAPIFQNSKVEFETTVTYQSPYVQLCIANAKTIDATWVRGVEFQRHEWHWTGYPVTFPEVGSDFDKWLSSFVGVESYRQEDNHILNTYFNDQNSWKIGNNSINPLVVHQHQLASGPRPAKYIAFSVRPKIRFSKWIKSDAQVRKDIESKVFVNGTLAKSNPIDVLQERIPVPPLKWVIPLTATYNKPNVTESLLPERTQNGSLLIFDEAFRRTDSLVRFGGIGDTIDIELMGTCVRDIHEFGVNPIFHPYERLGEQVLISDEAFGLTYDITRNAKVTQTGLVVRPRLANGKWMLAKARVRRLIHPDTIDSIKLEYIEKKGYQLPLRKVGNLVVPADFSVKGNVINLQILGRCIYISDGNDELNIFSTFSNSQRDLATNRIKFDIQVVITTNSQLSGYLTNIISRSFYSIEIDENNFAGSVIPIQLNAENKNNLAPSLLQASDYTDPVWLSFIGSFGVNAKLLRTDSCSIKKDGKNLVFCSEIDSLKSYFKAPRDSSACFQALMVYEPIQDIYKTGKEFDGGRLVGFYVYDSPYGKDAKFVKTADIQNTLILDGTYAYLITIQKASAIEQVKVSGQEDKFEDFFTSKNIADLELIGLLFAEGKESKIRITPEYMGPIKVNL